MRDRALEKAADRLIDKLSAARKAQKLSYEKLAKKAGLHLTTIGVIERHHRRPSILTCMKIAKALNIRLGDLINEVERER